MGKKKRLAHAPENRARRGCAIVRCRVTREETYL